MSGIVVALGCPVAMEPAYIVLGVTVLIYGASGIFAFLWAHRSGHLSRLDEAARSVFDPDDLKERDSFPGEVQDRRSK